MRRDRPYPYPCPVCRVAMIGEKSHPELDDDDIQRCFNCGAVVETSPAADEEDEGG